MLFSKQTLPSLAIIYIYIYIYVQEPYLNIAFDIF